jgi:hypothetical protein
MPNLRPPDHEQEQKRQCTIEHDATVRFHDLTSVAGPAAQQTAGPWKPTQTICSRVHQKFRLAVDPPPTIANRCDG